jgi:hypothetical protein
MPAAAPAPRPLRPHRASAATKRAPRRSPAAW